MKKIFFTLTAFWVCLSVSSVGRAVPPDVAAPEKVEYETAIINNIFQCPREVLAQVPTKAFVMQKQVYWTAADALTHIIFSRVVKQTDLGGVIANDFEDVADLQIKEISNFDGATLKVSFACKVVPLDPI